MSKILGYGEDAFTLWALKQHISRILEAFKTKPPLQIALFSTAQVSEDTAKRIVQSLENSMQ